MSSGPDLYLVCKSCGAEVSPYITECPYCGTRIQKRAPKLDRGGVPKAPQRARSRPQLPRLRPGEIPGIRADRRPWAVVGARRRVAAGHRRAQVGPARLRRLRVLGRASRTRGARSRRSSRTSRPAMRRSPSATIALFGWLLERRHGWWAPLLRVLRRGRGRRVRRRRGRRRGRSRSAPTAPRWACWRPGRCATCSAAARASRTTATCWACWRSPPCSCCCRSPTTDASGVAGVVGGVIGILFGLLLARLPER